MEKKRGLKSRSSRVESASKDKSEQDGFVGRSVGRTNQRIWNKEEEEEEEAVRGASRCGSLTLNAEEDFGILTRLFCWDDDLRSSLRNTKQQLSLMDEKYFVSEISSPF